MKDTTYIRLAEDQLEDLRYELILKRESIDRDIEKADEILKEMRG